MRRPWMLLLGLLACSDKIDLVKGGTADGGVEAPDGGGFRSIACPIYQSSCGGSCIPTSDDPSHCGTCANACSGSEVCWASGCAPSCPLGLTPCAGTCADTMTSNEHCGGCTMPCPTGSACLEGSCQPIAVAAPSPIASCPDLTELEPGGSVVCADRLAQTTYRFALCVCGDAGGAGTFSTDGFDSTLGPYAPGGLGGGVGVNGAWSGGAGFEVFGSFFSSAMGGMDVNRASFVQEELHLGGPLHAGQPLTIGYDAFVDGNVRASAAIDVRGTLHLPPSATITGTVARSGLVREAIATRPPCDCAEQELIPVSLVVANHQSDNDDASIGLRPALLMNPHEPVRLDLGCGRFFLDQIQSAQPITIVAHGKTALYVGGPIRTSAPLRMTTAPSAELDIFVGGGVEASSTLAIGSLSTPASTRIYIGGNAPLMLPSGAQIAALVYAPRAPIMSMRALEMYGALIAARFMGSMSTAIHYDRAVLKAGAGCAETSPPSSCRSCLDCGNQACVGGACGACSSSSDCCAPLVCAAGSCVPFSL